MIRPKIYLYDSTKQSDGYRGQDLSDFILTGSQNTENLTEELDISEITLQGLPIKEEFTPGAKFIIDILENGEIVDTFHRVVQEDVVEKPILINDNYYTHTITLIEPSAIAQKRIVDNIAVTYKLKDVTLETRTTFDVNQTSNTKNDTTPRDDLPRGFNKYYDETDFSTTENNSFGKYIKWENADGDNQIKVVYTDTNDAQKISDLYYTDTQDIKVVGGKRYASFLLPTPHIMWGRKGEGRPPVLQTPAYADIGVASFVCRITEKDLGGNITNTTEMDYISSSDLGAAIDPISGEVVDTAFPFDFPSLTYLIPKAKFLAEYLIEEINSRVDKNILTYTKYQTFSFAKYTDTDNGIDLSSGVTTAQIEVKESHYYEVTLEIKNLASDSIPLFFPIDPTLSQILAAKVYSESSLTYFCYTKAKDIYGFDSWNASAMNQVFRNLSPLSLTTFQFYGSGGPSKLITSGNPYSALSLVKKAILNSDTYYKKDGVSSVDIAANDLPFYVSDEGTDENTLYASDLNEITINEAFFRQKNLWEILLEVGKYAHAIPQITFGDDDKFAISFYKLGGTNIRENKNTTISIMNFRKIDDYISACSSYVDNLVQLGGSITEKVAPKSSSEDYLVYNDTAQIIVTKPITEILHVYAVCANTRTIDGYTFTKGDRREITEYIFEESVYNLLSVRYDQTPNRGLALFYKLGEKVIRGGDYQLPQAVTNPYTDYAFKKILFAAFQGYDTTISPNLPKGDGPWYELRVNDFTFEVEYRTKDTARVEHTRPDLRHYLIASKHDKVPTYRQFNNQQDIMVDSVAFGGNMFGKLIRTGNTNYKIREWCKGYSFVKHKGDLYEIDGEWYYVARVTNIFFPNHIESVVEYSKDYNQLSEIIGIPSEPRFYEISERSNIDREISINDYFLVTTDATNIDGSEGLLGNLSHTKDLIFALGATFLKWAVTKLKGDPEIDSSEIPTFGVPDFEKTVISPVNAYSCGNTLTYEWDMEDNFSAGDEVSKEAVSDKVPTDDNAYRTMRAVQYCDQYGKGTLLDFALYGDLNFSPEEIRSFPNSPIIIGDPGVIVNAWFDCTKPAFSENWLVTTAAGNTVITPKEGTIYRLVKAKTGTLTTTAENTSLPTDAQLDQAIFTETGNVAVDGDVVQFTLKEDNSVKAIYLYKRASGTYTSEEIWNNDLGDYTGNVFVQWNSQIEEYQSLNAEDDSLMVVSNFNLGKSIIVLKDCRETLHYNYNLMQITDSDTFVLSPFFFTEKPKRIINGVEMYPGVKIVVLSQEVNKMSNGFISSNAIIAENLSPIITVAGEKITVDMSWIAGLSGAQLQNARSIVIMEAYQTTGMQKFIIAKNGEVSSQNWYFGTPKKDAIFKKKQ